jgi:enoyl-CoA hydratase
MATDSVQYEASDAVAAIALDDGKANALSPAVIAALNAALDRAEREGLAVLLSGRPGRFSAGLDLTVMTSGMGPMRALLTSLAELALRLYAFPRPVVIACTGHALAGGAVLLLAADLRLGTPGAFKIGLNEVAIQLPLPLFILELARDRLSPRWFAQATLQARIFDPDGARDAGYLDELAASEALLDAARQRAAQLAALPTDAFRLSKDRARRDLVARVRAGLDTDITALIKSQVVSC